MKHKYRQNLRDYLLENKEILKNYCDEINISLDKLLLCARSFDYEFLAFQFFDENSERAKLGLKDDIPAKILLIVRRTPDGLSFEPSDDIRDYLA